MLVFSNLPPHPPIFTHPICQYAEKVYGIKASGSIENLQDDDDNIEASIQKEIAALNATEATGGKGKLFTAVWLDIPCVLFFKTREPIEPVGFVKRICEDAVSGEPRRSRFVNRLTPMTMMGKATEKGLEELSRAVLGKVFDIVGEGEEKDGGAIEGAVTVSDKFSYPYNLDLAHDLSSLYFSLELMN